MLKAGFYLWQTVNAIPSLCGLRLVVHSVQFICALKKKTKTYLSGQYSTSSSPQVTLLLFASHASVASVCSLYTKFSLPQEVITSQQQKLVLLWLRVFK